MKEKRNANLEFMRRRQKQLHKHIKAIKWLHEQGLNDATIETFGLGLAGQYIDKQKNIHENALIAPIRNATGSFTNQTIYINIPKITVNPENEISWVKGTAQTYYANKHKSQAFIIICEDVWDLWAMYQSLNENKRASNLLLISPTPNNSDEFPEEWKKPDFWMKFEKAYLGFENSAFGERRAAQNSQIIGCETRRLRPPLQFGTSWADFWRGEGKIEEFFRLFSESSFINDGLVKNTEDDQALGRYGYRPIHIGATFHRGHFYYPVETLVNSLDVVKTLEGEPKALIASRTEVVVVRSDRTIHTVREETAPRGTPLENRILRLTDGTLIASRPKASIYSTWSWQSIEAYCQKRGKTRSLSAILKDIKNFLRQEVWLPYEYDYDLLTLLVPVTFAQAIFQAVPMILVTGEAGSGKSALGTAMCQICSNAVPVGQISAAAVARLIHETKGFVVLDDLESIGKRSKGNSAQFNELVQALKLSYNKDTSWKLWTDVSRGMRVERLNFFGVKMINNTSGVDAILGSRMLKIITRKIPEQLLLSEAAISSRNQVNTNFLRDELHTWTFENVALIDATYKRLFPQPSDRGAEIAAPLRVFAEIVSDADLTNGLEKALSIKKEAVEKISDPIDLMMRSIRNIVRAGYHEISTTHVVLEMKLVNSMQPLEIREPYKFKPEKWESPAWVGRHLRTYGFVETNAEGIRSWLFGKSLRIYPVKNDFLKKIVAENEDSQRHLDKKPLDFCGGCSSCVYRDLTCPLMSLRMRAEV